MRYAAWRGRAARACALLTVGLTRLWAQPYRWLYRGPGLATGAGAAADMVDLKLPREQGTVIDLYPH